MFLQRIIAWSLFILAIAGVILLLAVASGSRSVDPQSLPVTVESTTTTTIDWSAVVSWTEGVEESNTRQWYEEVNRQEAERLEAEREAQARREAAQVPVQAQPPSTEESDGTFRSCVAQRESGGDYTAHNGSSGASGKYQFMPATGNVVANGMGRPDLVGVPVSQWSAADQEAGFDYLYALMGESPWAGGNYDC